MTELPGTRDDPIRWRTSGSGRLPQSVRSDVLRKRNAALVWEIVMAREPVSRAEIGSAAGLSPGAVTKIISQLTAANFVAESAAGPGHREPGRPRVPLEVDRSRFRVAGVHLGLRRTTVGLVDLAGRPVTQLVAEHSSLDPDEVVGEASDLLLSACGRVGSDLLAAGVCVGGWVDPQTGTVRSHPVLGWTDVPLCSIAAGVDVPMFFDTSVRAHAQAEVRFGAAVGVRSVLYLFIGNIIGAAYVIDGSPERGRLAAAGGIDHLTGSSRDGIPCACGRTDCLWSLASDVALAARARERGLLRRDEDVEAVLTLSDGQPDASAVRQLLLERATHVGEAVGALVDFVDPDLVVIGGSIRREDELTEIRSAAARRNPVRSDVHDRVVGTRLGESPLVTAAATVALSRVYEDPLSFVAEP